jgi:hypothetical protein
MGRVCRICYRSRPHEHFGGRGERAVVCKVCRRKTREERVRVFLVDEIVGFLDQSNIFAKNIRRLEKLETEAAEDVALLASLVRRIAQVRPRKRRRWKLLRQQHPELFQLAAEVGFLDYLDPECLGDVPDDTFGDEEVFDVWIEPRPYEVEPTFAQLRLAEGEGIHPWSD